MVKSFLSLCITFFGSAALYGQPTLIEDTKTIPVLVFENFEKDDTRFIREGGAIKYKLRGDLKKFFSGKIETITEKSMTVNGQEIQFANCAVIKGRIRTDKEMIGGVVAGIGFTAIGFGTGLFGVTANGAIASASVGAALFATGMVFMFNKKKFDLNKGWTVRGGTIQYSLTD